MALGLVAAAGIALMVWTPIPLMPEHHETSASLWRQLAGGSYVWWAIAVIAVAGTVVRAVGRSVGQPAAASGIRAGGLTAISGLPSLPSLTSAA